MPGGQVAFHRGGADGDARGDLPGQGAHGGHGLAHARHGIGGPDDERLVPVEFGPGVLRVHARDDRDMQLRRHGRAHGAACRAIPSGIEGRAGEEQVGLLFADEAHDGLDGLFLVARDVVVTADDGGRDRGDVLELRGKSHGGADGLMPDERRDVRLVFYPYLPEELVEIVDDLYHGVLSVG